MNLETQKVKSSERDFNMSFFGKIKDALYSVPSPSDREPDDSTEVWLRRNNLPPLPRKSLIKRIGHAFLCHRIHASAEYKGQGRIENRAIEHIDWGMTAFFYCAIVIIILIAVFLIQPGAGTTGWFGTQQTP